MDAVGITARPEKYHDDISIEDADSNLEKGYRPSDVETSTLNDS
jgi:hypothetical protein